MTPTKGGYDWDVFISYASEDREQVARPLAVLLDSLGVDVWYDELELEVGDSLRDRIDTGLASSRYGVVILSPSFFGKQYPERELNGLTERERKDEKVLLPVWYRVDESDIRQYSPSLADRMAARWEQGLHVVATEILEVVRPDIAEDLADVDVTSLRRLTSGRELGSVVGQAHSFLPLHDEFEDEEEARLVGGFLQEISDWGDIWGQIDPAGRTEAEYSMSERLEELEEEGWTVFGVRNRMKMSVRDQPPMDWEQAVIFVARGQPDRVFQIDRERIAVIRDPEK